MPTCRVEKQWMVMKRLFLHHVHKLPLSNYQSLVKSLFSYEQKCNVLVKQIITMAKER
jgi:hypothetical protein